MPHMCVNDFSDWLIHCAGKLPPFCLDIQTPGGSNNKQNKKAKQKQTKQLITRHSPENRHIDAYITLTHWGRATYICVSKLNIIGSDNGLSPGRRQAIIWTNAGILLIEPLGTHFNEIFIEIHAFSFKKIHLKMSSGKWRPFCLSLNVMASQCVKFSGVIIDELTCKNILPLLQKKILGIGMAIKARNYFWKGG